MTNETLREDITEKIVNKVIPTEMMDAKTRVLINPTGRFVVGGPHGDAGVTGRKIIVDTYGGAAPHGGGAFSGKDPDQGRSLGVLHGALRREERRRGRPRGALHGAARLRDRRRRAGVGPGRHVRHRHDSRREDRELVRAHFKLTPRGIIESLDLRRPIYKKTAAFGHFGRTEPEFTWERTDKAAALRADGGR